MKVPYAPVHSNPDTPPTDSATPPPAESPVDATNASPPPAPPRLATWPAWVKGVDFLMLILVLAGAFLLASNIARNHDQWLYYASGRALLNGDYSLGSDPFSHATADRTWVNHSWLISLAAYGLYSVDPSGFVIVMLKAILFAGTFGSLYFLWRPSRALWPWVLVTAIAVVAAAPHATLRPVIVSGLFLAVTLNLVLLRDRNLNANLRLIVIGVLFWLWASTDSWFILGPLTIALVLLGELLQRKLVPASPQTLEAVNPVPQLARMLIVGVIACSLTPHHVRVWQLPVEFGLQLPVNYQTDEELALTTLSPTNWNTYYQYPSRGGNVNGYAFLVLLIVGGAVLATGNILRSRIPHLLLWIAFAALALVQYRLILFFSIVAVPILGLSLSSLIDRIRLGSFENPKTNLLILLSRVGRLIAFPAAILFAAACYPGYLQPKPSDPSQAFRSAWGVEADPGLKRTAILLNEWRESGKLPDDYLGLFTNFDLANHMAWFAPKVKVYANSRYAFHAPELPNMIKARRVFLNRRENVDLVEIENFREISQAGGMTYVVYTGLGNPPSSVDVQPLYLSTMNGGYSLWHVDGRAVVLGDTKAELYRADDFAKLAFDPIRLAFQPDTPITVPKPPTVLPVTRGQASFLDDFLLDLPKPRPVESLDAAIWQELATRQSQLDFEQRMKTWPPIAAAVGNIVPASQAQNGGYRITDLSVAYNVLALRATWQAIAMNPDTPDPYIVLAQLNDPSRLSVPGLREDVRGQLRIAGLRQAIDRSPPAQTSPNVALVYYLLARQLTALYQPPEATARRQPVVPEAGVRMIILAGQYLVRSREARDNPDQVKEELKTLEEFKKQMETLMIPANDSFQKFKAQDLATQVKEAVRVNLLEQAADKFAEAWRNEDLGKDPIELTLLGVRTYLLLGQLDKADFYLKAVEERLEETRTKENIVVPELAQATQNFRSQLWMLRGNYQELIEAFQAARLDRLNDIEKITIQQLASRPTLDDYLAGKTPALSGVVGTLGFVAQRHLLVSTGKWEQQVDFFTELGVLLMLQGRNAEAKIRFEQAINPEGIELPGYFPQRAIGEQYLRMLRQAEK